MFEYYWIKDFMEQLQQGFTDSMQEAVNEEIKKSAKSQISVLIY